MRYLTTCVAKYVPALFEECIGWTMSSGDRSLEQTSGGTVWLTCAASPSSGVCCHGHGLATRLCELAFVCLSQLLCDRARWLVGLGGLDCCQVLAYTPCSLVFEGSGGRGERFLVTIEGVLSVICCRRAYDEAVGVRPRNLSERC